jgi:pSer/pThr/pTyr-binding forkhead associated (FHA) protein
MPPKLLLKFHAAVIKEIPIDKTPITIGRKPDNDIVIDNMAVSSHHARIMMQGASYVVEDTQSTNGTFLNDKKIINSALKHNDNILVGQHTLTFSFPESTEQEAPKAPAPQKPMDSESTVVMSPQRQQQVRAEEAAPAAAAAAAQKEVAGIVRVIEGKLDQPEYPLTQLLTYIGKSDTAAIKIKGMFAPDIAALISKRPTGYLLTAVKDGYPKLNNKALSGQTDLKDGDLIEIGGIKLLFQMK